MRIKAGPNLIRQTITRFWQYNIYIQKPYAIEHIFINLFKFIFFIKIFLTNFRISKLQINNIELKKKIKDVNYHNFDFSTLKLNTFLIERKSNKYLIFCNINSRRSFYLKPTNTFLLKTIKFKLEKKLKKLFYSKIFKNTIINNTFIKTQVKIKKIKNKSFLLTKQKMLVKPNINFFKIKNKVFYFLKNIEKFYLQSKKKIKKSTRFKILNRLIRRPLKKNQPLASQQIQKKIKIKMLNLTIQKNKYYLFQSQKTNVIKKKILILKKNQTLWIKKNKIPLLLQNWKIIKKIKQQSSIIKNFKIQRLKKKKLFFNLEQKNENFNNLYFFIYSQFFNKLLEQKIRNYINSLNNLNNLYFNFNKQVFLKLQQTQNFPLITKNLTILEKPLLDETRFLKNNRKFYKNFLNLLPTIELFLNTENFNKQFALELARTRKHWRIIKSVETLFIKFFIQLWETLDLKSQISGIQIIITGRPNKSSRTQYIVLKFGHYKQTTFTTINTTRTFSAANAQIGTFGITMLLTL